MPCDIDIFRARFDAIEDRMAAPDSIRRIERGHVLFRRFIARIECEAEAFQDCGRPDIILIRPERGAARRAARAHNTLGRFHQQLRVLMRLQAFHFGRRLLRDEEWLYHLILAEEITLIDRKIFDDREIRQRLDHDGFVRVDVLKQHRTGKPILAIDTHSVRAAHAVRARAPECQRPIDLPLDLVQRIEHAKRAIEIVERVIFEIRLSVLFRIVALDAECCGHVV